MNAQKTRLKYLVLLCVMAIVSHYSDAGAKNMTTSSIESTAATIAGDMHRKVSPQRPVRIGVTTFTPIAGAKNVDNRFGEYLSESLVSALKKEIDHFRLFERQRLDLILKENALALSGLISEKQAQRIGELAPVDALLSGTYTVFDDAIALNTRLVDAVTGEILYAYTGQIVLTTSLRSLFQFPSPAITTKPQQPLPPEVACRSDWQRIENHLADLTTQAHIDALVDDAVKIPFDTRCGRVHFKIIGAFKRYRLTHTRYRQFLLQSLETIQNPSADSRAREALRLLTADGEVDKQVWQTGLEVIKRIAPHYLNVYLGMLLSPPADKNPDMAVIKKRIDTYFHLAVTQQIGRPVAVEYDPAFFEMLGAFSPFNLRPRDTRPLMYCFQHYHQKISVSQRPKLYRYLKNMYLIETDTKRKQQLVAWMCDHFRQRNIDTKLGEDMFAYAGLFENKRYREEKRVVPRHLELMVNDCRDRYSQTLGLVKYRSQREDRIHFCLTHAIPCPEIVPSLGMVEKQLFAEPYQDRIEAAKILEKMGAAAAPAEKSVIKLIRRVDRQQFSGATNLQLAGINILGNIQTANPEALELLVQSLDSRRYMVAQTAADSLAAIGTPAIPYLIAALNSESGGVQYKAVKALEKMGPEARPAVEDLKRKLKSTRNPDVRDAIEDALEEIKS